LPLKEKTRKEDQANSRAAVKTARPVLCLSSSIACLKLPAAHFKLNFLPFTFQHSPPSLHQRLVKCLAGCTLVEIVYLVSDVPQFPLQTILLVQQQVELGAQQN